MRVLGLDAPGRAGFGAWAVVDGATGRLVAAGDALRTSARTSEADQLRALDAVFGLALERFVAFAVFERPFIFEIAQWVGAAKLAAATRGVRYAMLHQSSARKLALGHGDMGKGQRARRQAESLAFAVARFGARRITTQHRADAALYAVAGVEYLKLHPDAAGGEVVECRR